MNKNPTKSKAFLHIMVNNTHKLFNTMRNSTQTMLTGMKISVLSTKQQTEDGMVIVIIILK